MKKILSTLLAFLMVASVFFALPFTVNSAETEVAETSLTSGYYTYTVLSDGTAEITKYTGWT